MAANMKSTYSDVVGKDMTLDTGYTYLDPISATYTCATSVILKSCPWGSFLISKNGIIKTTIMACLEHSLHCVFDK